MTDFINLPPYEEAVQGLTLDVPELYNFGFDLIDKRAEERDKVALIYDDSNTGEVRNVRFSDLKAASNRFANLPMRRACRMQHRHGPVVYRVAGCPS